MAKKITQKQQKILPNSSMLNGSFLLLVQILPDPKQPSCSESWLDLDNGSIVDKMFYIFICHHLNQLTGHLLSHLEQQLGLTPNNLLVA